MKTLIAITAVVASLAGASAAFAFEPTNGSAAPVQSSGNIDRTVVGSITQESSAKADSGNLNAVYGFNSGRGVTVGTPSHEE
ncbi:MAG: hypothetical protein K0M60_05175 [Hydrogenophaga sp.]|nr:hypothetical protein [Hydrogenophaga sp.]